MAEERRVTTDELAQLIGSYRQHYLFLLGINQEESTGQFSVVLRRSDVSMTPAVRFDGTLEELLRVVRRQLVAMEDYTNYCGATKRYVARHGHATLVVRGRLRRVLCCDARSLRQHEEPTLP